LDLAHGCDEVAPALLDGLQKYPSVEKEERRKAEEERKNQKSTATGGRASKASEVSVCEVFVRPSVSSGARRN